jgi:putative transposase
VRYAFIRDHRQEFRVQPMCRVLKVQRSGFYKWLFAPKSPRRQEDEKLLGEIRHFFRDSDSTYGSPRIHLDLQDAGFRCAEKRVARLMRQDGLRAERTYKRRRYRYFKPSVTSPNLLKRDFSAGAPNEKWVTDITQVRTHEGWLYLAIVEDLFSRMVVGWSMQASMSKDLVLDAVLMAVWKRRPKGDVLIHSDQGSQYGSEAWKKFCQDHGLVPSMSRRGNCHDNAAMESFNGTFKKERVRGRIYATRSEGKADTFEYIEMFYNPKRRHSYLGNVSPMKFEELRKLEV